MVVLYIIGHSFVYQWILSKNVPKKNEIIPYANSTQIPMLVFTKVRISETTINKYMSPTKTVLISRAIISAPDHVISRHAPLV
jgi:hypothetical protein